ncbi:MAG: hypothetical protein M0P74_08615 [Syntrophales bacterium]|jgi:hypothetical protein|nr:hypothetical protein [Syntrophales bacterium]
MSGNIRVKAGKQAYEIICSGGFNLDHIATYFGPAGGPRWLVTSGFDLTLLREQSLGRKNPVWLVGASAGAWRFAAWPQPEAEKSYAMLMEAYITAIYNRKDTPRTILRSLTAIVNSYIEDDGLPFALSNKRYRLAILTTRMKNLAASDNVLLQKLGFLSIFLANAVSPPLLHWFAERVVFYYGARPPDFCLRKGFKGRFSPLNEVNFKSAVIASGAIPLVVAGVRDIFGAPDGVYRDGGLLDYNINQDYRTKNGGLTLFFHHQERIIPGWMDKVFKKRRPPAAFLDHVLMVCPAESFIQKLPNGRIPDRNDFATFIDDPQTRIANWKKTVALAAPLGEEFLELIASNRLRDIVEIL